MSAMRTALEPKARKSTPEEIRTTYYRVKNDYEWYINTLKDDLAKRGQNRNISRQLASAERSLEQLVERQMKWEIEHLLYYDKDFVC